MLLAAGVEPSWYLVLASAIFAIGATGLLVRRARRADPEQNEASTPGSAPGGTRTVTA